MDFKNTLRKEIDNKLSSISLKDKHSLSIKLTKNLMSSSLWEKSNRIFLYLSFRNEVITDYIIDKGKNCSKKIYAPMIDGNKMNFYRIDNLDSSQLVENKYGIMEPPEGLEVQYPQNTDLFLVPGVGFSLNGNRLGRGGGFYDRYLSSNTDIIKIGISFEAQLTDRIPTEEWDINMNYLLTENDLYKTGV